jgi:hypothetical protein
MFFGIFRRGGDAEKKFSQLHDSLSESFSRIKNDMESVGDWIKHFNDTNTEQHGKIDEMDKRLLKIEEFILNMFEQGEINETFGQVSKQKQTAVRPKQTVEPSKQTFGQVSKQQKSVQTDIEKELYSLTPMERTVVWSLLNTDMLLSYEDLSRVLGKDTSTVRGQINNIKRKIPQLILEKSESNGKKRFYVEEDKKREILVKYVGKNKKKVESES